MILLGEATHLLLDERQSLDLKEVNVATNDLRLSDRLDRARHIHQLAKVYRHLLHTLLLLTVGEITYVAGDLIQSLLDSLHLDTPGRS